MNDYAILVRYLPKMIGSRAIDLTSFQFVDDPKDANAQIIGLKIRNEMDYLLHNTLSTYKRKGFVIKLETPSVFLLKELDIYNELNGKNNVIKYICDFPCTFTDIIWSEPLKQPSSMCEPPGTPYHMILMEYINGNVKEFLQAGIYTGAMFNSIVKQVGLSLMEMNLNNSIHCGTINRGNLLLKTGEEPRDIIYSIGDLKETVSTEGNEVLWTDFQRGLNYGKGRDKNKKRSSKLMYALLEDAKNEISIAYALMKPWTKNEIEKQRLYDASLAVSDAETEEDLFNMILHV